MDRQPGLWEELEDTDGKMSSQKYATPNHDMCYELRRRKYETALTANE